MRNGRKVRKAAFFRPQIAIVAFGATLGPALAKAKSGGAVDRLNGPAIANTGGAWAVRPHLAPYVRITKPRAMWLRTNQIIARPGKSENTVIAITRPMSV